MLPVLHLWPTGNENTERGNVFQPNLEYIIPLAETPANFRKIFEYDIATADSVAKANFVGDQRWSVARFVLDLRGNWAHREPSNLLEIDLRPTAQRPEKYGLENDGVDVKKQGPNVDVGEDEGSRNVIGDAELFELVSNVVDSSFGTSFAARRFKGFTLKEYGSGRAAETAVENARRILWSQRHEFLCLEAFQKIGRFLPCGREINSYVFHPLLRERAPFHVRLEVDSRRGFHLNIEMLPWTPVDNELPLQGLTNSTISGEGTGSSTGTADDDPLLDPQLTNVQYSSLVSGEEAEPENDGSRARASKGRRRLQSLKSERGMSEGEDEDVVTNVPRGTEVDTSHGQRNECHRSCVMNGKDRSMTCSDNSVCALPEASADIRARFEKVHSSCYTVADPAHEKTAFLPSPPERTVERRSGRAVDFSRIGLAGPHLGSVRSDGAFLYQVHWTDSLVAESQKMTIVDFWPHQLVPSKLHKLLEITKNENTANAYDGGGKDDDETDAPFLVCEEIRKEDGQATERRRKIYTPKFRFLDDPYSSDLQINIEVEFGEHSRRESTKRILQPYQRLERDCWMRLSFEKNLPKWVDYTYNPDGGWNVDPPTLFLHSSNGTALPSWLAGASGSDAGVNARSGIVAHHHSFQSGGQWVLLPLIDMSKSSRSLGSGFPLLMPTHICVACCLLCLLHLTAVSFVVAAAFFNMVAIGSFVYMIFYSQAIKKCFAF